PAAANGLAAAAVQAWSRQGRSRRRLPPRRERGSSSWQAKHKASAACRPLFNPNAAAAQLDEVFDDREAEAGAARIARARLIDAIEALEDARQVFFGDARPFIGHGDEGAAGIRGHLDADPRPLG